MPKKTNSEHFDQLQYSLFVTTWLPLIKPIKRQYKLEYMDIRLMVAIDAVMALYSFRLNGRGANQRQLAHITGFNYSQLRYRLPMLIQRKLIVDVGDKNRERVEYNYKLTNQGKHIVNIITGDINKVHERIIDYLYSKKLLKH